MNSLLSPFFLRDCLFSPLSSELQKSVDAFIIYEMSSLADNICWWSFWTVFNPAQIIQCNNLHIFASQAHK